MVFNCQQIGSCSSRLCFETALESHYTHKTNDEALEYNNHERRMELRTFTLFMAPTRNRTHAVTVPLGTPPISQQTYGIYGTIQSLDKKTTIEWLAEQCYTGFALNSCEDLNSTAGLHKEYAFETQFTDPSKQKQQFCLQCCTKPVPLTGVDETWNLSCPLNDLQRLSVSQDRRVFRFARRDTLLDETIIECSMPNRTQLTYLSGYALTLYIIERTVSFGANYWRSVVNCSVQITESTMPPTTFNEVIRIRSIPTPQTRPTAWVMPTVLCIVAIIAVISVPVYKGGIHGQRCLRCGSWLVYWNHMCWICVCISCKLHPPPAKIYVDNGKPHDGKTM
ncbi:hypothetical protein FI667_g4367, partial [Globisporangium splendens]